MTGVMGTITFEAVGGWLAGILVSAGVLWGLLMLLIRGFWDKTGKPAMKETLVALLADPASVEARKTEILGVVDAWHNAPAQIDTRKKLINAEIDNAVNRTDGLISMDTTLRLEKANVSTAATFAELKSELKEIVASLKERSDEERARDTATSEKISRIEGGIEVLLKQSLKP